MARTLKEALNGVNLKNANADSLSVALTTHQASPRTDAQLRAEAERSVGSLYNQKTLAAQQAYDRTALGLRNQLDALSSIYAQQKDNAAANTRMSLSQADRRAMSRGMGRSSYTMATLGNMQTEGDKVLDRINTQQTNAASDVQSRLQLANQQLADILSGYTVDKEMDVLSRVDAQRAKDEAAMRDATQYNNSLIMGLADRAQQQQETAFNQGLAQKQFDSGREDAAFNQGMMTKEFEAGRADALFSQGQETKKTDAYLADLLFNQGLSREKLDADKSNILFNQTMSQKEFDAKLDSIAFDQGISREQLDLNIKKVLADIEMAQKEFDVRYGGKGSGGGNTVVYRDKTDNNDNKPRVLTGQPPINPNISKVFAGVKPITNKLGLLAVPANPLKTVFGNPATTAPKPTTTSPFNYNKPYTKQGGSTLMNRLNSLSS